MRLLDVNSVSEDRLPVFHDLLENSSNSPLRYAILSHTWGKRQDNKDIVFDDIPSSETFARFFDEETQLKQWQTVIGKKKMGFSKVLNACRVARELGMGYIWIDSCCIDKSKSAELNESINSMYSWYQKSEICIVYLEDLEYTWTLGQCRWFKRGWTLQELVAPSKVSFYSGTWAPLGEKSDTNLCESLESITGIGMAYLQGEVDLSALSIAHRMSWANGRKTTVPEDCAYSLMGIFEVNMPLLYGEGGPKAFQRLQEEIVKHCSDLSIFAWDPICAAGSVLDAFASTPNHFTAYKDMVPSYQSQHFTTTNKGIEMRTILWRIICADRKERLMLPIGKQRNYKCDIGIVLRKVGHNMYMRLGKMCKFSERQITSSTSTSTFYLVSPRVGTGYDHFLSTSRGRAIVIPLERLGDLKFCVVNMAPENAWDCEDGLFFNNRHWGGSDWRALHLVKKGSAPNYGLRLIALFDISDETPKCFLLRWNGGLDALFRRRHQRKTTKLKEFRYMVKGSTNEIEVPNEGVRLSLRLIPKTNPRFGGHFQMDLQKVPRIDSGIPNQPLFKVMSSSVEDIMVQGHPIEMAGSGTAWSVLYGDELVGDPGSPTDDDRPGTSKQPGERVFSQYQITEKTRPWSEHTVMYATMSQETQEITIRR